VMWRREDVIRTGQEYLFQSSEDYYLWARLLPHIHFANLPEVLVRYRIHKDQRSIIDESDLGWKNQVCIRLSVINLLGIMATADETSLHQKISTGRENEISLSDAEAWLKKLQAANRAANTFPQHAFDRIIADRWWVVSLGAKSKPIRALRFIRSSVNSNIYLGVSGKMVILARFIKQRLANGIKRILR